MALMPVEEALARVLEKAEPLPAEFVEVGAAHGRVLAADLAARRTQPPAAMSSMDGYAVRAADVASVPARLRLIGEVAAGRTFPGAVGPGEAARILTGGVVPAGADTIVIQENARREGDVVIVEKGEPVGRYIRRAGLDFAAGDRALAAGRRLTTRDLALAAAMNHAVVPVVRRPRIAVFSTGDELRPPGSRLAPGQIISSNSLALAAMARAEGALAIDLGIVSDRLEDTIAAVRRARDWGADILATTGGASVGDYDLVQPALVAEGMQLAFWKVALRPGKPLMHGRLGRMWVLGLPGNPVSAYVCGLLFLVPLIRKLAGRTDFAPRTETAILGCDLPANDERQDYMRSTLVVGPDGKRVATPLSIQDSSMMSALAQADCLVVRPPHAPAAKAGEPCTIIPLPL
ncbi:MAG: molybdopterin molybdotransferase MoeA [Variibacter sp.]|nr:molybdopterin molybdotransferase MoeA [Variibacter sp.]